MAILIDTNILVRLANSADVFHAVAAKAVVELHRRGETLHVTAQNLIEFHAVATRPTSANGLGYTGVVAESHAATFVTRFPLLPETADIYPAWRTLVSALDVVGKNVHDARLAAVCHVHRVGQLLTFDVAHFSRLATEPPGIAILDPARI